MRAEGVGAAVPGANFPLHTHNVFHTADLFGVGKPTMVAWTDRDVRQAPGSLPVAERIAEIAIGIPWFKRYLPPVIEAHAAAYRKVALQAKRLLD